MHSNVTRKQFTVIFLHFHNGIEQRAHNFFVYISHAIYRNEKSLRFACCASEDECAHIRYGTRQEKEKKIEKSFLYLNYFAPKVDIAFEERKPVP